MRFGHRIVWTLPLLAMVVSLIIATRTPPAAPTIEFIYLNPVDSRTYWLIASIAFCGPVMGWTFAACPLERHRGRRRAFWLSAALASALTALTLMLSDFGTRTVLVIAVMSALQAGTVFLLAMSLIVGRIGAVIGLGLCIIAAAFALLAPLQTALSLIGILMPTYWVGDILVAEQMGQESYSAGWVGLTLHLLPLTIAIGLSDIRPLDAPER